MSLRETRAGMLLASLHTTWLFFSRETLMEYEFQLGRRPGVDARAYIQR